MWSHDGRETSPVSTHHTVFPLPTVGLPYGKLENIGSRIDMQTHAGGSSTRPQQHASLATVRP